MRHHRRYFGMPVCISHSTDEIAVLEKRKTILNDICVNARELTSRIISVVTRTPAKTFDDPLVDLFSNIYKLLELPIDEHIRDRQPVPPRPITADDLIDAQKAKEKIEERIGRAKQILAFVPVDLFPAEKWAQIEPMLQQLFFPNIEIELAEAEEEITLIQAALEKQSATPESAPAGGASA